MGLASAICMAAFPGNHDLYGGGVHQPEVLGLLCGRGWGGRAYEQKRKARLNLFLRYLLLIGLGIVMIYPLCWMIGASFKTNSGCFSSAGSFPWPLL